MHLRPVDSYINVTTLKELTNLSKSIKNEFTQSLKKANNSGVFFQVQFFRFSS